MATKTKKTKAKAETKVEKPTLVSLLARAGQGYAKTIRGLCEFTIAYVQAIDLYGAEGKKAFRDKYALYTESDWASFEDVGKGRLLPQFAFCSGNMKRGLLRLEDSLTKQMNLIGCVKSGKLEVVNAEGKIVLKSLEDLSKLEEDSILFALKEGDDPNTLRKFARDYRVEFKLRQGSLKPTIEIVGDYLVLRRGAKLSKAEVQQWLNRMP
jgi:hypothetical protein